MAASSIVLVLLLSFLTQIQRIQCPTGYLINPSDVHAIYGTSAQFRCLYSHLSNESVHFAWRYNFDSAEATHIIDQLVSTTHNDTEINSTLIIDVTDIGYNGTEVYCLALITEAGRVEESEVAKLYVTDIPDIEKPTLTAFSNGTLHISWDSISMGNTPAVLHDEQLSYDLVILNGRGEECERLEGLSHDIISYNLIPSNLTCNAQGLDGCESIFVQLTPIINNEFSGDRTEVSTALQPFSLVQNEDAVMIANDTFQFSYRINTTVPLSFCTIGVYMMNKASSQSLNYSVNTTTMRAGPTNDLRIRVEKHMVPFGNHYTAVVSLGNGSRDEKQVADNNISLSTYAIQNVSQQNNHIVIHFVHGTNVQGAFIVYNNTEGTGFNYSMASRNDEQDTAELQTVLDESKCSISVYDVRDDGLLTDNGKESLRPSYFLHNQPCIMRDSTQATVGISTNAIIGENFIVFECKVTDASLDTNGCIAIVHDRHDYSTLYVSNIPRNSQSNMTVEPGNVYAFVIFEWAKSGLLSSEILKSGMLSSVEQPLHNRSSTTESELGDGGPHSTSALTHSTSALIILLSVVVAVAVIILIVVIVIQRSKQKQMGQMRDNDVITQHSEMEYRAQPTTFEMQEDVTTSSETEEELLLKDETSETEMETIDNNIISVPIERAFYDAPGKPKILQDELEMTGKDFNGVSARNNRDNNYDTASREKIQEELKELEYPLHSY